MKKLTQTQRVLLALRARPEGITAADFMPPTIDGGKPIMRVAARIYDLREEGHRIADGGKRGTLDVYVLRAEAPPKPVDADAPRPSLFTVERSSRGSHYDDDLAA